MRKNRHANGDQGSSGGAGSRSSHRATASSSQLSVDMTEQYLDSNGRVEITCLATIPEHVKQGDQYADYKTFSMRGKSKATNYIGRFVLFRVYTRMLCIGWVKLRLSMRCTSVHKNRTQGKHWVW